MKKVINLVFVFAMVLSALATPLGVSAQGNGQQDSCGCSEKGNVEKPAGFEEIENEKSAQIYGKLASNKEFKEAVQWLRSEDMKLKPSDLVGVSMDTIGVMGDRLNNVNHFTWIAKSKDGKDIGTLVAIVNQKTGELEHLKADIYNNITEEGFETVSAYIMGEGFTGEMTPAQYSDYLKQFQSQEPAGEFGTLGFSACDHASVWLCLHHCGMWALLNGFAGLACGAICGYAFSYAC
jgi:putative immunity protein/bacteriocin